MSSTYDVINVSNVWARKAITVKNSPIMVRPPLEVSSIATIVKIKAFLLMISTSLHIKV